MDRQNHTDSSTFRRSLREIKLRYLWTWLADQLGQPGYKIRSMTTQSHGQKSSVYFGA